MINSSPKTILVADDEPAILKLFVQFFQNSKENFEILHAPNGKIACELAVKKIPDLIILDWYMPIMTGIDAVRYLKSNAITTNIPIIIATGTMIEDEHLEEALENGAIDYIRKPFSKIELLARSRSAIFMAESHKNNLEQKARELTSISVQIAKKNEILQEIKEKLEQMSVTKLQKEIIKIIENNIQLDDYWEKFKMHFQEVHPYFFEKLKTNFSELSQNELKFCAYIKMRLSNKEIAQLLNISPKGIETARYRIKKKFNLEADEALNGFIQAF